MIMEVATYSSVPPDKLKSAVRVFRDIPPLPKALLDLFRFCSAYYHHPLGEVAMNGLPGRLRSIKPFVLDSPATFQYCLTPEGHTADISVIPTRSIVKHRF